jgi:hypothetical protein
MLIADMLYSIKGEFRREHIIRHVTLESTVPINIHPRIHTLINSRILMIKNGTFPSKYYPLHQSTRP